MTTRPAILQMPGRHSSLLVSPEDDAKVFFCLQGMQIRFYRNITASDLSRYEFPDMQNWEIEDMVDLLMRDSAFSPLAPNK